MMKEAELERIYDEHARCAFAIIAETFSWASQHSSPSAKK